jgi:hypothetical protein
VEGNNIQSVINSVASENGVEQEKQETEVEEQNQNGDPTADEGSNENDGSSADENSSNDDGTKDHKAFAAMRVKVKSLETKLEEALKSNEDLLKKYGSQEEETGETQEESEDDPLTIKESDSEEIKLLKTQIAELKSTTSELKQDKEQRITQEKETQLVRELSVLRTEQSLDKDALLKFAEDAEKQGFILGQTPLSVKQIYTLVYHDDLVKNAVKSIQDKTNADNAPGTGPGGSSGGNGKTTATPQEVVGDIIKNLNLK